MSSPALIIFIAHPAVVAASAPKKSTDEREQEIRTKLLKSFLVAVLGGDGFLKIFGGLLLLFESHEPAITFGSVLGRQNVRVTTGLEGDLVSTLGLELIYLRLAWVSLATGPTP